ncbi:recombinase family protein [Priestia flexa]|uniref:recombinase family protein n=1 Tax=Priestia flexa TaxID=86664 RepID=UPI0004744303|nr:recombinase family protein [Priestia flexa]
METTKMKAEQIKDVAIYLRKSRGEEEDLAKHREELVELCKKNNWRYTLFAEVGSSASIEHRPELNKLVEEIKQDQFDALVVIERDRLSRERSGQAFLLDILAENGILIVTPQRIYDLNNDNDIMMSEFEDLFSRMEYRAIRRRLVRGKKRGAKRGEWTNGRPPFPYDYDAEKKGLIVNQSKLEVYNFMKENFLDGMPFYEIAWELNKMGIKSPRNGVWHENTVRRILIDETHLGRIISNKTEGSGHKTKKAKTLVRKQREEWIVVENCHEAVKTEDEHERIKILLQKRRLIPVAARKGKTPLSGLLRCSKCGCTLQYTRKKSASGELVIYVRKCQHSDPFGERCHNLGGNVKYALDAINYAIDKQLESYKHTMKNDEGTDTKTIRMNIKRKLEEIEKKEKAIDRIDEAYEEGVYDLKKYNSRMEKVKKEILQLEEELEIIQSELKRAESMTIEEKIIRLEQAKGELSLKNLSMQRMNKIYSSIIDSVIWTKEKAEDKPHIHVNFL